MIRSVLRERRYALLLALLLVSLAFQSFATLPGAQITFWAPNMGI